MNDIAKGLLTFSSASHEFFKNWVKGSTGRASELIPAVSLPVNLALSLAAVVSLRTAISYSFTRKGEAKSRCVILNEIAEILDKWELICIREVCTCCQEGVCVLDGDEAELARLVGGPQLAVLSRLWHTNWNRRLREKPVFFNGTLSQAISTDFKVREYISLSLAARGILTLPADLALLERLDFIIQYGVFRRLCLMEEARSLREMSLDGPVTDEGGVQEVQKSHFNDIHSTWGRGRGRGRGGREIWRVCGKPSWLIPHGYQDGRKQRYFCLPLSYLPVEAIMTHSADWLYSEDMDQLRAIWRNACKTSLRQSCRAVENMILREWVNDNDIEINRNAFAKYRYLAAHTIVNFWFHRYALRMIRSQKRMMERGARNFYQSRLYSGNPWGQGLPTIQGTRAGDPSVSPSSQVGVQGSGHGSTAEAKLEQEKIQQDMAARNRRMRKLLLLEGVCMCTITALECTATRVFSQLPLIAAAAMGQNTNTASAGASMLRAITSNIILSSVTGVGSVIVRQVKKRVTDQLTDTLTKEVEEHFANLLISSDHAFLDRFFAARTDTMKRGWRGSREMSAKNLMRRTAGSGGMLIGKFDNVVRRWATGVFLVALSMYRRDVTALCIAACFLIPGTEDLQAKASVYFGFSQSYKARPLLEDKSLPQEPRYGLSLLVQVLSERTTQDQRLRRLPQLTTAPHANVNAPTMMTTTSTTTTLPTMAAYRPLSPTRYARRYKRRFFRAVKALLPSFLKSSDESPWEHGHRRKNEVVIDAPVTGSILRGTLHPALSFIACSGVWKMDKVVGSTKSFVDMTPVQRQLQFEHAQRVEDLYTWLESYKLDRASTTLHFLRVPLSPMQENVSYLLRSTVQPSVRRMLKLVMNDGWAVSPIMPNMVSAISHYSASPPVTNHMPTTEMVSKLTPSTELLAKNQVLPRDLDPEEQVLVRNPVNLQYLPENNGFSSFSRKTFYLLKQLGLESVMAFKVGQADREEDPALVNLESVFEDEYSNPFAELVGQCMDLVEVIALSTLTCTVASLGWTPLGENTGLALPWLQFSTDYSNGAMILTRGEHIRNYRQSMRTALRFRGDNLSMFALYELFHYLPCSISDNSALSRSPAMTERRLAWRRYIESGKMDNGIKQKQLVFDDQHRIIGGLTLNSGIQFHDVCFLYPQLHHINDNAEKRQLNSGETGKRGGRQATTGGGGGEENTLLTATAGVMDEDEEEEEAPKPFSPATRTVSSLSYDAQDGVRIKPALFHANITFPSRGMTAVIGRTGAGKSTLFHLLKRVYDPLPVVVLEGLRALNPTLWSREGLREILEVHAVANLIPLPPSEGECTGGGGLAFQPELVSQRPDGSPYAFSLEKPGVVTFDGIPAACFSVSYQRQWLVQMEQSPSILTKKTFQENIRFVYDTVRKSDIEKAAVASRSMEFIEREPLKLLQPVSSLSGGEQQRLGLARTLAVSYAQARRYRLMHSYADHEASKRELLERVEKAREEAEEARQRRRTERGERQGEHEGDETAQKPEQEPTKEEEEGSSALRQPSRSADSVPGPVLAFISTADEEEVVGLAPDTVTMDTTTPSLPFTFLDENGREIPALVEPKKKEKRAVDFSPFQLTAEDEENEQKITKKEEEEEAGPRRGVARGGARGETRHAASRSNHHTHAQVISPTTTTTVVGLLLDEPTSRLDVHNEMKVERAINDLIRRNNPISASPPPPEKRSGKKEEEKKEGEEETKKGEKTEAESTEDGVVATVPNNITTPPPAAAAAAAAADAEEEGAAMVIMIAHRLSTIQAASHVVVIADGQVETQGPPRYVFDTSPFAKRQMELQFVAAQQAAAINLEDLDIPEDPGQRGERRGPGGRDGGAGRGGRFPGMFRGGRGGGGGGRRRR